MLYAGAYSGGDLRCPPVLADRLLILLATEVGAAEEEVGALVLGVVRHELLIHLQLTGGVAVGPRLGALDREALARRDLVGELTAWPRCSKNSVPVGELFARLRWAMAKLGSLPMALRKYCRESSRRRFSARVLPLM